MISVELRFHLPEARLEQKFTWKYTEILFRNRWIENYSLPYGITPARGTSIMETYMFIPLILSLSDDTGAGWRLGWSNS